MDAQKKKEKIEQMKKGLDVAKKVAIKTGKVSAKIGKKILKKGKKITIVTARASYKGTKKAYKKYRSLDKDTRRNLHHGLLVASGFLGLAATMDTSRCTPENSPEPLLQQTDTRADSIRASLTKTYKITDKASFKALYEASLPLIHISMLPTEIFKESAYDDRGGANPNSIAVGLFWFPKDGNPTNSEWIRASKYLKQHKDLVISYEKALTYTDAWCRYREGGRVYNQLFKRLQGSEITPHQFAACFTTTYNSETSGFKFCDFVQKNYKNPIKCAHYLLTLDPKDKSCADGILKRHTAEACLFMYPEYAMQMYSFKMKNITYVNKKGETKHHTVTSVN
ncbi:MAG: hypothetical protein IKR92_06475, partial [Alphaproteobacteria bacterium]|nr:hypothetical protein [Alphaproteobacteria bacterium]